MGPLGLRVGNFPRSSAGSPGEDTLGETVLCSLLGPGSDGWGKDRAGADTQEGLCPTAACGAHVLVSSCSCNKTPGLAGSAPDMCPRTVGRLEAQAQGASRLGFSQGFSLAFCWVLWPLLLPDSWGFSLVSCWIRALPL